jgi:diguanylate cyclase (GGDEF)-like protein
MDRGAIVDSSRNAEVTRGVVLPLVLLVVILAVGIVTGQHAVYIGMMAAVPMLAAVFAGISLTAIVAVISVVAGTVLAFMPGDEDVSDSVVPLVVLVLLSVLAVAVSNYRKVTVLSAPEPVARRKGAQFQLQTQADLDSMTGLLNRRGAIRALGSRSSESERVVAFLDCDLFKSVNEQYGSDVGDEFLQAIAGRLRHRLPSHDTVARWDGDEFLLAIAADAVSARPALERLVSGINGTNIRTTAGPIPATVSVGAALWSPGQELEDVISRAGRALYAAKNGGRSQIVVDGEGGASAAVASSAPVREAELLHDGGDTSD